MNISNDGLQVTACANCDISIRRTCIVNGFGDSDEGAFTFIAEAPGYREDKYGLPLIGKAGELFTMYLEAVGLNRDLVYTTNVIKCKPPYNRTPTFREIGNCLPMLKSEITTIQPKMVILLGNIATWTYFQNFSLHMPSMRNKYWYVNDKVVLPIYHPSFILRNSGNERLKNQYFQHFVNIARLYKELVDPFFTLKY